MRARMKKQQGATMVEYAIMVAMIALAVAVTVSLIGFALNENYKEVRDCVMGMAHGDGAANCPGAKQK